VVILRVDERAKAGNEDAAENGHGSFCSGSRHVEPMAYSLNLTGRSWQA
jgi:hypothetical protein